MAMRRVWVWSNALLYFPVGNPVYGLCIFDAKVMLRTSPVVCILLASSVVFSLCSKGGIREVDEVGMVYEPYLLDIQYCSGRTNPKFTLLLGIK